MKQLDVYPLIKKNESKMFYFTYCLLLFCLAFHSYVNAGDTLYTGNDLQHAIRNKNAPLVLTIIEGLKQQGTDFAQIKDSYDGNLLLSAAANLDDESVIEALLSLGLEIDGTDSQGNTPLMLAAGSGNINFVKALIKAVAYPSF